MAVRVQYQAYDREGKLVRGVLEADSPQAAEESLWNAGLIVAQVRRLRHVPHLHELLPSFFGPNQRHTISIARQLATLLDAGFAMLPALEIVAGEQSNGAVRESLLGVRRALAEGQSFSEALSQHPALFPAMFVRLARIGEETGELAPLLLRAADHLESGAEVRATIRNSLTYPVIVMVTAGISVYILLTFSIPMLAGLLEEFEADLPTPTRIVIAVGNLANRFAVWVLLGIALFIVAFILYRRTVGGRRNLDRWLLRYPPLGGLLRRSSIARMTQTLSSLLYAGIPLLEAMEITEANTENVHLRESLGRTRQRLLEGNSLSRSMEADSIFPHFLVEMSRVGEETGKLADQLIIVQGVYEREFKATVARIVGFLEPALILLVGGLVGLIGATVITTVYSVLPAARSGAGL